MLLGPKALHLQTLKLAGFRVPDFVSFDTEHVAGLSPDKLAERAHLQLNASRYAVRSSALVEDTDASSMAGQFRTELDIAPDKLSAAIDRVLDDARTKLGDLKRFSLIVQTCLKPEWSGVIFTRHPSNKRQTVIEYARGFGEALVSGAIKPERREWFRAEAKPTFPIPDLAKMLDECLEIEKLFNRPQDIEWAMQNGVWYVLQARPITTISAGAAEALSYLDTHLPKGTPFLFDQTELSEVAARPRMLTLDLLKRIYSKGGPVEHAYKTLGIFYRATDFLRIIGNQLYVDRNAELRGLLPSYEYTLNHGKLAPKPIRSEGALTSLNNLWKLKRLHLPSAERVAMELAAEDRPLPSVGLAEALKDFLRVYELIFKINLYAQCAGAATQINRVRPTISKNQEALVGNSLDFGDASPFVQRGSSAAPKPMTFEWLRESGRKLTVRHIDRLRRLAFDIDRTALDQTFDELLSGEADPAIVKERRDVFEAGARFDFHGPLTNIPDVGTSKNSLGISPGIGEGVLVTRNEIDSVDCPILYTHLLTPDLAQYFPRIRGLVADQGGLLSHLAILAREHRVPAIVLGNESAKPMLRKRVRIDGTSGELTTV